MPLPIIYYIDRKVGKRNQTSENDLTSSEYLFNEE
jgi:hypothetical protein